MADDDVVHEMVMPFVVVESVGGPFDDAAFCAGWEMGQLDADLDSPGIVHTQPILTENRPQADLIAMKHGWVMTTEDSGVAEWLHATFTRDLAADDV